MGKYATDTSVSAERTLAEIQGILKRYGATRMGYAEDAQRVELAFEMHNRRVRFSMPLPDQSDFVAHVSNQYMQKGKPNISAYEQAIRSRWRALLLAIKAKLESVESQIETFDEAFMAQLVLPSGETMGHWALPQIAQAYDSGSMPRLLTDGG